MDKTQALVRLSALENEASELRKIIEAPEPAPSLLTKPVPRSGARYWYLKDGLASELTFGANIAHSAAGYPNGNVFQSLDLAKDYAESIDTMLRLRHQPGTVPAKSGYQWILAPEAQGQLTPLELCYITTKMQCVSPCFATEADVNRAIEVVGKDRLLRMFKTFHHVKD